MPPERVIERGASPSSRGGTLERIRYFDHAASRPIIREALETYTEVSIEAFGNPSSSHAAGLAASSRLREARSDICTQLGFSDGRLLLAAGATEANNLVIQGHMRRHSRARLLIAADVHPSIWFLTERYPEACRVLPMGSDGAIDPAVVTAELEHETSLVCMSHVCNETGTVHPVREVAGLCSRMGVPILCDGAQAAGNIPLRLDDIPCDFYTISAHKFGGPRGVGGVLLRSDDIDPIFGGGLQEWRLRPGTENVAGAAAAATALRSSVATMAGETDRLRRLSRILLQRLDRSRNSLLLNSDPDRGLPGLVSVTIPGLSAHEAVVELSLLGFALSAGSACHANQVMPSRAILARGRPEQDALGTLRISMGSATTDDDVEALAAALMRVIENQRSYL